MAFVEGVKSPSFHTLFLDCFERASSSTIAFLHISQCTQNIFLQVFCAEVCDLKNSITDALKLHVWMGFVHFIFKII